MQGRIRKALLVLVFMGLVGAAAPAVSAQLLHHVNPYNYAAGIREIGLYTMVVPGTVGHGHLWPLPALVPPPQNPLGDGGMSTQSYAGGAQMTSPSAPAMSIGATARSSPTAPSPAQSLGLDKTTGAIETPMGG